MQVKLLPSFANDLGPINAAKVSFAKEATEFDAGDHDGSHTRLIRYLTPRNHFTCFTHSRETFSLPDPIDFSLLSPTDVAGMVWSKGCRKVRHSLWGWRKLVTLLPQDVAHNISMWLTLHYPNVWPELHDTTGESWQPVPVEYLPTDEETDPAFIDATFRISSPIPIARQQFKHMVEFAYNETSRRYVDDEPEFYHPSEWRERPDGSIKQGSGGVSEYDIGARAAYTDLVGRSCEVYNAMIALRIAPEQARFTLLQGTETEYIVTGSLTGWRRMVGQRTDDHAQLEIQDLANPVNEQLTERYGDLWEYVTR